MPEPQRHSRSRTDCSPSGCTSGRRRAPATRACPRRSGSSQQFELRTRPQHERLALVVREEHLAVHRDRRRREAFALRDAEPPLPHHACPVVASKQVTMLCHVVDHVEMLAVRESATARTAIRAGSSRRGDCCVTSPRAARPDRQRRTGATRRAEHHAVAHDRRRNHFVVDCRRSATARRRCPDCTPARAAGR